MKKTLVFYLFLMAFTAVDAQTYNTVLSVAGPGTNTWTNTTGAPVTVRITARGGDGGRYVSAGRNGGSGATEQGVFTVANGETIRVIAGGGGFNSTSSGAGGGAGASGAVSVTNNSLLLIAAGAGGGRSTGGGQGGFPYNGSNQGTGSGGTTGSFSTGGGGGLNSAGQNSTGGSNGGGQISFSGVSLGSAGVSSGGNGANGMGGGSGANGSGVGGNGGGYTGGSAGGSGGLGGSSYNTGTSQVHTGGCDNCGGNPTPADGWVTIEALCSGPISSNSATQPTINTSSTNVCVGGSITLSIGSGNLNDAANWQWYRSGCGIEGSGFPVGSGSSIVVSPTGNATYYVRGEGCVTAGACASVAITANNPQVWYLDADNDLYYTSTQNACSSPGTGWHLAPVTASGDCNDNNASIHPNITEVTGNNNDDNCNGLQDENQALSFDGLNDNILGGIYTSTVTQKTFCAWVKMSNLTQTGGAIISFENGTTYDAIVYNQTGQGWGFGSNGLLRSAWSGVKETAANQWVHIAVTYDNNSYKLYRNGVLILTTTNYAVLPFSSISRLTMGRRIGTPTSYFSGTIDEVQMWNTALSQAEIQSIMTHKLCGSESNLLYYFPLDQGNAGGANTSENIADEISLGNRNGNLSSFALNGSVSNWVAGVSISNTLYIDADNDGYDGGTTVVCYGTSIPAGYSTTSLGADCNDADNTLWQNGTMYIDADNDDYDGGTATVCYGSVIPAGYKATSLGADCNDNSAAVNPGQSDIPGNGIDEDCSGVDAPPVFSVYLDMTGSRIACSTTPFYVTAIPTFIGCSSSGLQWYEDGLPIAGATGTQLALNKWSVGQYYVKASCNANAVYSDTLNVNLVTITADSNKVCASTGLLLRVDNMPGVTYQWMDSSLNNPVQGTAHTYTTTYVGNVWCKMYSGSCFKYGKFRTFASVNCGGASAKWDENEAEFISEEELSETNGLGFSMFPNPATSQVNVLSSYLSGSNQLRVFDYNGRLVLQLNNLSGSSHILDISSLNASVYMVELTANGETQRQKLVVQ